MRRFLLFAAAAGALFLLAAGAAYWFFVRETDVTSAGSTRLVKVADLESPTFLTAPEGDERQFVTERAGQIRIMEGGRVLEQPFLDIGLRATEVRACSCRLRSCRYYSSGSSSRLRDSWHDASRLRRSADDPNTADPASRTRSCRFVTTATTTRRPLQFGPTLPHAGVGDGGAVTPTATPDRAAAGKLILIDPRPDADTTFPRQPVRHQEGARPYLLLRASQPVRSPSTGIPATS